MKLKAIGKCIDTLPIANLLSQEERLADTVTFEVDRYHNGMDLAEFTFMIRGVTESGGETESALTVQVQEELLLLSWTVNDRFTAEGGKLALDLYAYRDAAGADAAAEPPECILRYQLPSVEVRRLPESDSILETHSYTDFLLEVKATANDAIAAMEAIKAEFEAAAADFTAQAQQYDEQIAALNNTVNTHDTAIKQMANRIQQNEQDILALQEQLAANAE